MSGTDPLQEGRDWLRRLQDHRDLSPSEAYRLAEHLAAGALPDALAGALLAALAAKGEGPEEIFAFASFLRHHARGFLPGEVGEAVDLCGTGGAPHPTFNVSTVSAFVVAAGGLPVAKHGNSSARGPCGSSDLLEALGLPVKTSLPFGTVSFRRERLAFLHAPLYHPATARVVPIRRALGVRTIFNLLGPLSNPAPVRTQVVGCFDAAYARTASRLLPRLGVPRSLTFTGEGAVDEFLPGGWTLGIVRRGNRGTTRRIDGRGYLDARERRGPIGPLPPPQAAREAERLLSGGGTARRGSVLLTAGAAFWVSGKEGTLREGVERARELLDGGQALGKLRALQALAKGRTWS